MSSISDFPPVENLISDMASQLEPKANSETVMIGVHTGGVWVAQKLHQALKLQTQLGTLDITFYRDDFTRIGLQPEVKGSDLPEEIDDKNLILVDDVLHTGRTVRAALNEIFSFGRPAKICLAVLIDRNGRELPIQADVTGGTVSLNQQQQIKLGGPEELSLNLTTKPG